MVPEDLRPVESGRASQTGPPPPPKGGGGGTRGDPPRTPGARGRERARTLQKPPTHRRLRSRRRLANEEDPRPVRGERRLVGPAALGRERRQRPHPGAVRRDDEQVRRAIEAGVRGWQREDDEVAPRAPIRVVPEKPRVGDRAGGRLRDTQIHDGDRVRGRRVIDRRPVGGVLDDEGSAVRRPPRRVEGLPVRRRQDRSDRRGSHIQELDRRDPDTIPGHGPLEHDRPAVRRPGRFISPYTEGLAVHDPLGIRTIDLRDPQVFGLLVRLGLAQGKSATVRRPVRVLLEPARDVGQREMETGAIRSDKMDAIAAPAGGLLIRDPRLPVGRDGIG